MHPAYTVSVHKVGLTGDQSADIAVPAVLNDIDRVRIVAWLDELAHRYRPVGEAPAPPTKPPSRAGALRITDLKLLDHIHYRPTDFFDSDNLLEPQHGQIFALYITAMGTERERVIVRIIAEDGIQDDIGPAQIIHVQRAGVWREVAL